MAVVSAQTVSAPCNGWGVGARHGEAAPSGGGGPYG